MPTPVTDGCRPGDLVVLDFGGVYGGYCVDLTRTVALGQPDAEMQRVYDAVLEAQKAAIAAKAGVRAGDIDARGSRDARPASAGRSIRAQHRSRSRRGDSRNTADRTTAGGDGRCAQAPPDDAIEPGMVFTIEPGAYLPGWGGVRIEDDVLVTSDGVGSARPAFPHNYTTHGFRRD